MIIYLRGAIAVAAFAVTLWPAFPIGQRAAWANIDPPWGWPQCAHDRRDQGYSDSQIPEPHASMPTEYDAIYKAVEFPVAPFAPYFFPVLQHEEHRNWVRISRVAGTPNGKPKPKVFAYGSWREYRNYPPISMRIDKCTGAVSEVFFEHDKVK